MSAVVITATGLSMRTPDGQESGFLVYEANPANAIDELSRLLESDPEIAHDPGLEPCAVASITYDWGVFSLAVMGDVAEPEKFWVAVGDGVSTANRDKAEVALMTEHGGQVGGSASELVAKIPSVLAEHWNYEGQIWDLFMDGVDGLPTGELEDALLTGVRVHAIDDVILSIQAPVALDNDC